MIGITPLFYAIMNHHIDVAKFLVEHEAKVKSGSIDDEN